MASPQVCQPETLPFEVIAAVARGWRLLPVQARGKVPLVGKWPELATSALERLAAWATEFPGCNWGIATGPESGVFVLDVDGEAALAALIEQGRRGNQLPSTLTVSTGRGRHLYFRWPNGQNISNSAGKLAKGLDIRGTAGCVVIPPSIHPSGTAYAYDDPNEPIADAPEWLLALIMQRKSGPRVIAAGGNGAILDGTRHTTLVSLAGTMRKRGMAPGAIEAALLEENRQKCQPPLPEAEVRGIAGSMARYEPGSKNDCSPRQPRLVCLLNIEAKPVEWLWEPYLPMGMLSLVSGDPGAGKTYLALAIAAALSNGRTPFTGQERAPVDTVYLSLENSPEHVVRPRFDSLQGDASRFHLLKGSIASDGKRTDSISLADTDLLGQAISQVRAGLVIVDPIQSYFGADVDTHRSNETRPILDGLVRLADEHHCCFLLVRHLSKASGRRAIHNGLGSIDITGAARTEMMAGHAPNEPSKRALVHVKSNIGRFGNSLGYTIGESGFAWSGISELTSRDIVASDDEHEKRTEISAAIDFLSNALASGSRLMKEIQQESGLTERTLQRAAGRLKVKKERDGKSGPWRWSLPDHTRQAEE